MDTNISANTLFHFTSDLRYLLNILSEGFYVRYSLEDYRGLLKEEDEIALPMTCFCDIPISHTRRHALTYGNYALGLSKDWGHKNNVNPVIYTYPDSETTKTLERISDLLMEFHNIHPDYVPKGRKKGEGQTFEYILKKILEDPNYKYKSKIRSNVEGIEQVVRHFGKYIKPYEGKVWKNGRYDDVRFYDEREWRFVPANKFFRGKAVAVDAKASYAKEYYVDERKRRAINMKLAKHIRLKFQPNDIRYIIVEKENEIPGVLDFMDDIEWGGVVKQKDLKILATRLISMEQIHDDM